jgi:hypothetical protein
MTTAQATTARALLKESLQWVGLTDLTDEEEEKAAEVQERIERLLIDLGDIKEDLKFPPARDRIAEMYRIVLATRARYEQAERVKDLARQAMDKALAVSCDRPRSRYVVRRFEVAYEQWERAERTRQQAEGAYYRVLMEEER